MWSVFGICWYIRYIRSNNPHLAFALHILQNQHEYGHMNNIMNLLKLLSSPNMLIPYKEYYIQAFYREGKLIPEQYPGETNPLFQTVIKPNPHIPHEQASCASAGSPDTTPAEPHPDSSTQQSKVCTVSDTQHQWTLAAHHITYPIMVSHHTQENIKSSTQ